MECKIIINLNSIHQKILKLIICNRNCTFLEIGMVPVNLARKNITIEVMEEELRRNPLRLEEMVEVRYFCGIDLCSPLMAASLFGNVEVVQFLLSAGGANIQAKNDVNILNELSFLLLGDISQTTSPISFYLCDSFVH